MQNRMELHFSSCPQNESFARVAIAAFAVQLNPTLPEMADIKTAVSEAVTNAIVHGYRDQEGMVSLCAEYGDRRLLTVRVHDDGCGIEDVPAAMQPFYSTGDGNVSRLVSPFPRPSSFPAIGILTATKRCCARCPLTRCI